jgi:transcriptional regulator
MYLPAHFAAPDTEAMHALMRTHPLALLILHSAGEASAATTADLIPLHFEPTQGPHGLLRGHVARANPLWRRAGAPVLAVFQGPQAYVSPGWYPSKADHGKVVPTWNYSMVQARGALRVIEDAPWLRTLVSGLTQWHEQKQPRPWAVDDAPEDYVQQMLRAIVGIEIPIDSLQGKFKLSQNRSAADRDGVIAGLSALPEGQATAAAMARGA